MHATHPSPRGDDPVELAALRLLCIISHLGDSHLGDSHLGDRDDEDDQKTLWGEGRLQILDHLLRHPESLALWLIDQAREQRLAGNLSTLASRLRDLLRRQEEDRHTPAPPRHLELAPWRSFDDALAFLTCRNLLRLESRPAVDGGVERGYSSTPEAATAISQLTSQPGLGQVLQRRCRLLASVIGPETSLDLAGAAQRLAAFVDDEKIAPEDDPTPRLFHSLFGEPL